MSPPRLEVLSVRHRFAFRVRLPDQRDRWAIESSVVLSQYHRDLWPKNSNVALLFIVFKYLYKLNTTLFPDPPVAEDH